MIRPSPPPPERDALAPLRHAIAAKSISINATLEFDAQLLPPGARGKFSSYSGDSFTVNLPPRESGPVTAEEVFQTIVVPLMRAMGFGGRIPDMRVPASAPQGKVLPTPSLRALAKETCREVEGEEYARFRPVCDAMRSGETSATAEREIALAYGMSYVQFVSDAERPRIQYVFAQTQNGVPIEHAGVIAERRDGESVTSVYGSLFTAATAVNEIGLAPDNAVREGLVRLVRLEGLDPEPPPQEPDTPVDLVLLPDGVMPDPATGAESVALRHAYRTVLMALEARPVAAALARQPAAAPLFPQPPQRALGWLAWIDAADGTLLQLSPQFDQVEGRGAAWKRDPGTPVVTRTFEVDQPGTSGRYVLKLDGVFRQFDFRGDGAGDEEVSIDAGGSGSSAVLANFDQGPLNSAALAQCVSGGNDAFRQVNTYAHLYSYREMVRHAGVIAHFPEKLLRVELDTKTDTYAIYDYRAKSSIIRLEEEVSSDDCPDAYDLPAATDATVIAHEFAHLSTPRISYRRPADWCGQKPCPMPMDEATEAFHDFADAAANAYASTPCMGGWFGKNLGGTNGGRQCLILHDEDGSVPRLASVREPFSTIPVQDHFPEKRPANVHGTGPINYMDGQIAATALWLTRQGMRSRSLAAGTAQYWIRFNHALYAYGFFNRTCWECRYIGKEPICTGCDRDIYDLAQDLLYKLAQQWVNEGREGACSLFEHDGAHTINKLLSAWARVGFFLVPSVCLDDNPDTTNPTFCPAGEMGGDAIIDVDDLDDGPDDDVVIDDVVHPETDYIERRGSPPRFRVWTGPRFRFDGNGAASRFQPSAMTPPCHAEYQIELSRDPEFVSDVLASGWLKTQSECYGRWIPPEPIEWWFLGGTTGDVKVYYRVRTRGGSGVEQISTRPGNGAYEVPPPYVVVNDEGKP